MSRPVVIALQVVLVVGLVLLLLVQVFVLPSCTADATRRFPEAAFLAVPVQVLVATALVCAQVAIGCVMALLVLVGQERIFVPAAHRYVDVFIAATAAASVIVLVTGVLISATAGSPTWVLAGAVALVGAGVALLMVMMRALLRQAGAQHAELAEVV